MFWKGFEVGRFLKQNCDSTKWINELQNTRSSLNPFWLDLLLNSRTSKMLWTKTSIETGGVLLDLGKSSAVRIESSHFAVWSYFLGNLQNRWRVVYNMKSENAIPKPKSKRRMKVFFSSVAICSLEFFVKLECVYTIWKGSMVSHSHLSWFESWPPYENTTGTSPTTFTTFGAFLYINNFLPYMIHHQQITGGLG